MAIEEKKDENWKRRNYAIGISLGTALGFLSSYLYSRSAEEELPEGEKPEPVPTGQMLGAVLAVLALVRQIAEMGKQPKKKE